MILQRKHFTYLRIVPIKEAKKNRSLLLSIMTLSGFDFYQNEWWHYQLFHPKKYPLIKN